MPRFFIVYEHRLFAEILLTVLGEKAVVGARSRPITALSELVEAIAECSPSVVILEAAANGNSAWHLLLSGGDLHRVVVLDIEGGALRDYSVDAKKVQTLAQLERLLDGADSEQFLP